MRTWIQNNGLTEEYTDHMNSERAMIGGLPMQTRSLRGFKVYQKQNEKSRPKKNQEVSDSSLGFSRKENHTTSTISRWPNLNVDMNKM